MDPSIKTPKAQENADQPRPLPFGMLVTSPSPAEGLDLAQGTLPAARRAGGGLVLIGITAAETLQNTDEGNRTTGRFMEV